MKNQIAKLIDVKSIVTLAMTAIMAALLLGEFTPSSEIQTLFATSYGAIITYFFTKKGSAETEVQTGNTGGTADTAADEITDEEIEKEFV